MPIQLRCFNNIWPFFTKVAPLPVWFLHPWLSATNGFYRNYQELGGKMGGGQKIVLGGGGGICPPPCPPLAPPLHILIQGCSWSTHENSEKFTAFDRHNKEEPFIDVHHLTSGYVKWLIIHKI